MRVFLLLFLFAISPALVSIPQSQRGPASSDESFVETDSSADFSSLDPKADPNLQGETESQFETDIIEPDSVTSITNILGFDSTKE